MEGYTQYTKLHPRMSSLLTWARADPSPLTRGNCAVTIDQREATGLDLAAEGFNQMYANPDNIEPPPFDQLIAAIASPYRLDIVRRRDYDPDLPEQPAIMGAVWRTPHPPQWLAEIHFGLMIIVVPDVRAIVEKVVGPEDLRHAWFAAAGTALAQH